jgi:hypothetical protein
MVSLMCVMCLSRAFLSPFLLFLFFPSTLHVSTLSLSHMLDFQSNFVTFFLRFRDFTMNSFLFQSNFLTSKSFYINWIITCPKSESSNVKNGKNKMKKDFLLNVNSEESFSFFSTVLLQNWWIFRSCASHHSCKISRSNFT